MTFKFLPLLVFLTSLAAQAQTLAPKQRMLQTTISSSEDEGGSFITPNGNKIFFVRNSGTADQENQDLYYADRSGQGWSEPVKVGGQVNNDDNNTIAGSNADGSIIYLNSEYDKKGRSSTGLSRSRLENGDYTRPEPLFDFKFKWPKKGFFSAYVPQDESFVIVSMNASNTPDNEDILVFEKGADGKFSSEPKNLGSVINTAVFESTPFYSQTYRTLFFNRPKSARTNEADILFSQRLDDSWTNWSPPRPVDGFLKSGSGSTTVADQMLDVNTVGFDGSFTIDNNKMAYFISGPKNDANAKGDVYAILLIADTIPKPQPEVRNVVDSQPTPTPTTTQSVVAETPDEPAAPAEMNFQDVMFDFNSDALSDAGTAEADRIVEALGNARRVTIRLNGYSDNVGTDAYNKALSNRRANAVKRYLAQKGIAANRIKTAGYGKQSPKGDNSSEEGRTQNRRVEVKISRK